MLLLMSPLTWAADEVESVSFSGQVLPLLMRECSYCHMREERYGYLAIDPQNGWNNLVNVPAYGYPKMMRVQPGEPDQSYLWMKLTGEHMQLGAEGWRMPFFPLPEAELDLVRRWIAQGALDN